MIVISICIPFMKSMVHINKVASVPGIVPVAKALRPDEASRTDSDGQWGIEIGTLGDNVYCAHVKLRIGNIQQNIQNEDSRKSTTKQESKLGTNVNDDANDNSRLLARFGK